ncbi:hypothetical protein [Komagataeibacter saccharivorans]|uniref:hypothetical protein n=1 Tax=Komagataeibacter saccharivorans TaxID=265959 RepID=UPI000C824EF6|nr:hypothetical protein [Komagataeibacter saccharivorans]
MTPLQAARYFDAREGFDVVDYTAVGLPIFRLTVEAVTFARLKMPTLHEFVLRSILISETDSGGIARLLGLSEDLVEEALATLAYDRCVALAQSPSVGKVDIDAVDQIASPLKCYEVTDIGLEKLREGQRTPRDEPLVFDYDGIRRHPIALGSESVRRPKELAIDGAIQIRPYPVNAPEVSELSSRAVAHVVRRRFDRQFERDILAFRRIARRESLFRPAIGLLYQSRSTDEVQVAFVVEDQLVQDYEIEFAKHGGAKKPGLIRSSVGDRAAIRAFLGPERSAVIAQGDELSRRRAKVTLAVRERMELEARLERLRRKPKLKTTEEQDLTIVQLRLDEARAELDSLPLRELSPYEQWELFADALESAKRRLYLTSSDISADVTDAQVLRCLNERLDEDVEVRIDTSVPLTAEPKGKVGSFEPRVELWLTEQRRNLTHVTRAKEHGSLYFLIKDDDLAIVTNRPFLCGRGRPLSFIPTVGVITRRSDMVSDIARLAGVDPSDPRPSRCKERRRG